TATALCAAFSWRHRGGRNLRIDCQQKVLQREARVARKTFFQLIFANAQRQQFLQQGICGEIGQYQIGSITQIEIRHIGCLLNGEVTLEPASERVDLARMRIADEEHGLLADLRYELS